MDLLNNNNLSIPSVGNFGGLRDKYIVQNGTSTTYPMSIGVESGSLWISSPNTIKFYNNGTITLRIDKSGNVEIGTTPTSTLNVSGSLTVSGATTSKSITLNKNNVDTTGSSLIFIIIIHLVHISLIMVSIHFLAQIQML